MCHDGNRLSRIYPAVLIEIIDTINTTESMYLYCFGINPVLALHIGYMKRSISSSCIVWIDVQYYE